MQATKIIKMGLLLAGILTCWLNGYGQQAQKKPNVIVILTDDQGYADLSCNGNPVLQTPALDQLYGQSVRFSNFHVSPLCTPSRGELMSGLDALHNKAATVGTGRDIMRRDIVTMPEVFRQNGYQTGIFGKWHLGDNYPDRPMDRGFQKCIWFKGWGLLSEAEYDNSYYKTRYLDSLTTKYSGAYCTDLWFNQAMHWMGKMADEGKPFFTYLATNAPHGPFDAPRKDYRFYKDKVEDDKVAKFFGLIRNVDQNMARLEEWLKEKKLADNTLIVFMNDNGSAGGSAFYNAGMRGKKGSNYDGGHRAVCFIRWPNGSIGQPRTVGHAAEVQDLLPTFIDLLDLKLAGRHPFDGVSLEPLLRQRGKMKDRMFVIQYGGSVRPKKYFSCVVWNSWRLVGQDELYNINSDPGEQNNVAGAHPDVLKKMRKFYERWWEKVASGFDQFIPLVIGASEENPVTLTSDFWADSAYVNTQWKVAQAGGPPQGGLWYIHAEQGGRYRLELSRWPFHLQRDLTIAGPDTAVGGIKIRKGRAVPVASGCVSLDRAAPIVVKKSKGSASDITLEMDIPAGDHTLQSWFRNENGQDVCGAYYVRIRRMF